MEQSTAAPPAFLRFLLRSWLWNLLITTSLMLTVLLLWDKFLSLDGNRSWFLFSLCAAVVSAVHGLLLFIFCIRRMMRKHWIPGACFLLHGLGAAIVTYYLFALWIMSIGFAMKA